MIWLFSYIVKLTWEPAVWSSVHTCFQCRGIFLGCTFKHVQMKGGGDKTSTVGRTPSHLCNTADELISFGFFFLFCLRDTRLQRNAIFGVICEKEMQNGWDQALNRTTYLAVAGLNSRKIIYRAKEKKTPRWFSPTLSHLYCSSCAAAIHLSVLVATSTLLDLFRFKQFLFQIVISFAWPHLQTSCTFIFF